LRQILPSSSGSVHSRKRLPGAGPAPEPELPSSDYRNTVLRNLTSRKILERFRCSNQTQNFIQTSFNIEDNSIAPFLSVT
jgi:hypothetical protein